MQNSPETLITDVELADDREHLIFHTKDNDDCNRLWSQLAGQLMDITEGRQSIPYNMPEDVPPGAILEIEGDLEIELKFYKFLAPGTTERIRKHINEIKVK